ncbi:MAG: uroporphyrinogen decarboxylase family protein [Candidatus Humimicrobiaceae bacterium]
MKSIDRIKATFEGEKIDRVGIIEYYWSETIKKWKKQGMNSDEPDYYFDHDIIYFFFDPRFGFKERLISEDNVYKVIYTIDGETLKIPKDDNNIISMSDVLGFPIDYTIKTRKDWEQYKYLYKAEEWRLHSNPPLSGSWFGIRDMDHLKQKYEKALKNEKFKCLVFREPYECIREIMGTDHMLFAMAEDPGWIKEMLQHNLEITFKTIEMFNNLGMKMDGFWVWGDIAYNKGLFFSPQMYREMLMPFHKELFDALGKYMIYHTDGYVTQALPLLLEAGIKGLNPIEIKAGNDFYKIVDEYGDKIVLTGGIDARIISTNDKNMIDKEIKSKVSYAKKKKYISHSDHSIPYNVDLDTYKFVIEKIKEYGSY